MKFQYKKVIIIYEKPTLLTREDSRSGCVCPSLQLSNVKELLRVSTNSRPTHPVIWSKKLKNI